MKARRLIDEMALKFGRDKAIDPKKTRAVEKIMEDFLPTSSSHYGYDPDYAFRKYIRQGVYEDTTARQQWTEIAEQAGVTVDELAEHISRLIRKDPDRYKHGIEALYIMTGNMKIFDYTDFQKGNHYDGAAHSYVYGGPRRLRIWKQYASDLMNDGEEILRQINQYYTDFDIFLGLYGDAISQRGNKYIITWKSSGKFADEPGQAAIEGEGLPVSDKDQIAKAAKSLDGVIDIDVEEAYDDKVWTLTLKAVS